MTKHLSIRSLIWKNPVHIIAFGFGAGLFPRAPGTFGTLVAIPFYWLLAHLALPYYVAIVLLLTMISCWICQKSSEAIGIHDYKGIVLDEMVGYWITMIAFPPHLFWIFAGFLWFRLFDVWKPWPISWIQKNVKGGIGIVLDDVVAAIFAWLALFASSKLLAPKFTMMF